MQMIFQSVVKEGKKYKTLKRTILAVDKKGFNEDAYINEDTCFSTIDSIPYMLISTHKRALSFILRTKRKMQSMEI